MPVIKIEMIEGKSLEQKRRIVKEITEVFVRVAGDKPEDVRIIMVEHPKENLASSGTLLSDLSPEGTP